MIGILLYVMTRSWQQTLVTLATMGVGFVWTLGVLGWLGWSQDGMLEVLPVLVVIVGVCDAVHLLSRHAAERTTNPTLPLRETILAAARGSGPACAITTITTAAAFASFTASDIDAFVRFGVIFPIGVIACLLLSFSLLPILIERLPTETTQPVNVSAVWEAVMKAIVITSSQRIGPLLVSSSLVLAFFGFGWAAYLHADNNWMESFGESSDIARAVTFVERSLGGSQTLEIDIRLPAGTKSKIRRRWQSFLHFQTVSPGSNRLGNQRVCWT